MSNWRKSSHSGQEDCIEIALGSVVGVRDTKDRAGGVLTVSSGSWSVFLLEVQK
ncbi:MAG: hypothetical protein QOI21_6196 [Actinomycetota bacterium]|nr:hypothetical protein [Actinomycetota bacterium]